MCVINGSLIDMANNMYVYLISEKISKKNISFHHLRNDSYRLMLSCLYMIPMDNIRINCYLFHGNSLIQFLFSVMGHANEFESSKKYMGSRFVPENQFNPITSYTKHGHCVA